MIRQRTINSTSWTAITSAGQQGSCWIQINVKGSGGGLITHSDTGRAPTGRSGFKLYKPGSNDNVCILGPDNVNDIFYARCIRRGNNLKLLVDVA